MAGSQLTIWIRWSRATTRTGTLTGAPPGCVPTPARSAVAPKDALVTWAATSIGAMYWTEVT